MVKFVWSKLFKRIFCILSQIPTIFDNKWLLVNYSLFVTMFTGAHTHYQGWGLLSQFPPFRYFLNFSALSEHTLAIEYHVYIWQVSPQLSCGGTCQIYTWFKESKRYFCQIENFACGEINERSFSNPHPWAGDYWSFGLLAYLSLIQVHQISPQMSWRDTYHVRGWYWKDT